MAQLMPLPLTVSCFSKIQIGFTFLVLAHPVTPRQNPVGHKTVVVIVVVVVILHITLGHLCFLQQQGMNVLLQQISVKLLKLDVYDLSTAFKFNA